jgi:uncharacterized repeat protein (TIGR03803 family)
LLGSRSAVQVAAREGTPGNRPKSYQQIVLHSFLGNPEDGRLPYANLVFDPAGNLYGTTAGGGDGSTPAGTVFELSPQSGGGWSETIIFNFAGNRAGAGPQAGLIFDKAGNLYGTTTYGGSSNCTDGCGTVFELSPQTGGGWSQTLMYNFKGGTDGEWPNASLIFDAAGNLYGTTVVGGGGSSLCTYGCGTVYELSPKSGGWSAKVLYRFQGQNKDGSDPYAGLIFDAAGNLYGTTAYGGSAKCPIEIGGCGTVFELSPQSGGEWSENVLYNFQGNSLDGAVPHGGLAFDKAGNLYGTTYEGGANQIGTVFELLPESGGVWNQTVLHYFRHNGDGARPYAGVTLDNAGNLYGTTLEGGTGTCEKGCGTIFRVARQTGGLWAEKVLYNFAGGEQSGALPYAGVIFDANGNLYGTTLGGGTGPYVGGCGTVFEVTP